MQVFWGRFKKQKKNNVVALTHVKCLRTLGSVLNGVLCLMKDLITALRPRELGVIISIWFFCTVWRKDFMLGLTACIFKTNYRKIQSIAIWIRNRSTVFHTRIHIFSFCNIDTFASYTVAFLGRREPLWGTFLYSIWCFTFSAPAWPGDRERVFKINKLNILNKIVSKSAQ